MPSHVEVPSPSLRSLLARKSDADLLAYASTVEAVAATVSDEFYPTSADLLRCGAYARALIRTRRSAFDGSTAVVSPAPVVVW